MGFKERIKEIRFAQDLTQVEMAKFIKISERQYQNLEAGIVNPRYDTLIAIADAFGISLDYLAGRTDNPKSHR